MFIFIGFILLIGLIFATFYVYTSPSDEEISRYQERLEKELNENPRSRSAKLRVIIKN